MKKIAKVVFIVFSIFFLLFSIIALIDFFPDYINAVKVLEKKGEKNIFNFLCTKQLIKYICFSVCSILLFLVINFKDLKFLTESLIEKFVSWRKNTEEERKENKQAKLQREIAEKQAELEKMKNDTKTE